MEVGYVDVVTTTHISGWLRVDLAERPMFTVINGEERPLLVDVFSRDDLALAGLSGVGFSAEIRIDRDSTLSVCYVDPNGEKRFVPFSGSQTNEVLVPAATVAQPPSAYAPEAPAMQRGVTGYIDLANSTKVSGWVIAECRQREFFAEINGVSQPLRMRFYSRPDLTAESIDAIGFEAHIEANDTSFVISIGYLDPAEPSGKVRLPFSETGATEYEISDFDPSHIVMTSQDIALFAGSVESDTELYLSMVQKYGRALTKSGVRFDVVFIDGSLWSVSTRYRILNVADGLRELGLSTLYVRLDRADPGMVAGLSARVVVFFRAPLDQTYETLLERFRKKGSRIVFDMDDLIVDETIISDVDGVRYLSGEEVDNYIAGVKSYKRFALAADIVTTSTPYLADYVARALGCQTAVVRNTIGKSYITSYPDERVSYQRPGQQFVIGYYSGSRTHQVDFMQAYPAVVRFLRTYSDAILRVVGMLDLAEFPDLAPVKDRIVTVGMMSYYEMIEDLGNCDVILAPLVPGDPFCEAKSELKFFEAALRGRPCIASATSTYAEALGHGAYGRVASTPDEWFAALSELYLSPSARADLAMAARQHAVRTYSYKMAGEEANKAYFGIRTPQTAVAPQPPPKAKGRKTKAQQPALQSVGVIMPDIMIGGGGHRKILKFSQAFANAGVAVTLYVDTRDNPDLVRKKIRQHFYDFPFELKIYRGSVGEHSALICTHWSTAFSLRNYPKPAKVAYFVQDFEAMFDAVGSTYVKAVATYAMGFHLVCYGNWVSQRILREFNIPSRVVPFSVDRSIYAPQLNAPQTVDILFFARPSQPRRCFELGVEALRSIYRANNAVRIALYGEPHYGDLGFPYHNFGLITDLSKLQHIYTRAKVGVCFSTTNPSLVGYEMLASGLPMIDIRAPGYEANFGGENFVYYSNATPESLATTMADALNNDADRHRRQAAGLEFIASLPEEYLFGPTVVENVTAMISGD
jgi:glycosyltransferase involved in cell wall biosynthesis